MTAEEFDNYLYGFLDYYYGDAGRLIMKYQDTLNDSLFDNSKYSQYMTGHTVVLADYRSLMHMYDKEGNLSLAFVDELDAIWKEINALETLDEYQRFHTCCAGMQFYSAAAEITNFISTKTKDTSLKTRVNEYRRTCKKIKNLCGA